MPNEDAVSETQITIAKNPAMQYKEPLFPLAGGKPEEAPKQDVFHAPPFVLYHLTHQVRAGTIIDSSTRYSAAHAAMMVASGQGGKTISLGRSIIGHV